MSRSTGWVLLLALISVTGFAAPPTADFEPFVASGPLLYRFQLDKLFPSEAAWKAEMEKVCGMVIAIEKYKGKVLESAGTLLRVMEDRRHLSDLDEKLYAFADFRRAINTEDRSAWEAQQILDARIDSHLSFLKGELKLLTENALQKLIIQEPGLNNYAYYLNDFSRMSKHILSDEKESAIAALRPDLIAWQENLYQKIFDRADFHENFEGLLRNMDRGIRQKAFTSCFAFYQQNADMLAFALRQIMTTLNNISRMRGFDTYYQQSLFERYLTRPQMDNLYKQIEKALPQYHAYQQFRMDTFQKTYGVATAAFFDVEIPPIRAKQIQMNLNEATAALKEALHVLGTSYSVELDNLLDPKNGRLDVLPLPPSGGREGTGFWGVSGKNRRRGAFCMADFGFFMSDFKGSLDDVFSMAHEAGHAMHYRAVRNNRGSAIFAQGPSYMTESFAMFNEWLFREYMLKRVSDPAKLPGLKWDVVKEMMHLWELARQAKFEMLAFDRVANNEILDEKGFNKACVEVGHQYDLYFPRHPHLQFHWMRWHHYWTVPTYYANYVLAHILALKYLQLYHTDPHGFPEKYVTMVSGGFDRPAPRMLKEKMNIDLEDPNLLSDVFDMIQKQFEELKMEKR